MSQASEALEIGGKRVMAGGPFSEPTLAALYAVPSGAVVKRQPLTNEHTRTVDRMLALAPAHGLTGPFARVGDREGRLGWIDPQGLQFALELHGVRAALRRPALLEVIPAPRAAALLAGRPLTGPP